MDVSAVNSMVTPSNAAAQGMEQKISSVRAQLLRGDLGDPRIVKALSELNRAFGAARSGNVNTASVSLNTASKIADEVAPATGQAASVGIGKKSEKTNKKPPAPKLHKPSSAPAPQKKETGATMSYQDSSSDPGASFKYPTAMTPAQAEILVPVHEQGHVLHEKAKAAMNGQEVVSATVTISRRWDPVAGQFVIVGGEAQVIVREKAKMPVSTMPPGKIHSAYVAGSFGNASTLDLIG